MTFRSSIDMSKIAKRTTRAAYNDAGGRDGRFSTRTSATKRDRQERLERREKKAWRYDD